jgi:hypothetical protein
MPQYTFIFRTTHAVTINASSPIKARTALWDLIHALDLPEAFIGGYNDAQSIATIEDVTLICKDYEEVE